VPNPVATVSGAVAGFALPLEGTRLLLSERRLWGPALIPLAISVAAVTAALVLIVSHAGTLHGWTTDWMPQLEVTRWFAWLWVGPARVLLHLLGLLLFLALVGVCLVVAYLVASLLAAPFHEVLSQRVERVVTGQTRDEARPGWRGFLADAGRSLIEELRRLAFFLALVVPLVLVGFVIPAAHAVTAPLVLIVTLLFLPIDYASYVLDRRRYSFREKRRWVAANVPVMLGFGAAAFLGCLVPVLNLAAMPLLVVGGTLLALRVEPEKPEAALTASPDAEPRAPGTP